MPAFLPNRAYLPAKSASSGTIPPLAASADCIASASFFPQHHGRNACVRRVAVDAPRACGRAHGEHSAMRFYAGLEHDPCATAPTPAISVGPVSALTVSGLNRFTKPSMLETLPACPRAEALGVDSISPRRTPSSHAVDLVLRAISVRPLILSTRTVDAPLRRPLPFRRSNYPQQIFSSGFLPFSAPSSPNRDRPSRIRTLDSNSAVRALK